MLSARLQINPPTLSFRDHRHQPSAQASRPAFNSDLVAGNRRARDDASEAGAAFGPGALPRVRHRVGIDFAGLYGESVSAAPAVHHRNDDLLVALPRRQYVSFRRLAVTGKSPGGQGRPGPERSRRVDASAYFWAWRFCSSHSPATEPATRSRRSPAVPRHGMGFRSSAPRSAASAPAFRCRPATGLLGKPLR